MIPFEEVNSINSKESFLEFLRNTLRWPVPEETFFDELTFEWVPEEIGIKQEHLRGSKILQLRPLIDSQPWGIFILELSNPNVYVSELRRLIRGFAPAKRKHKDFPTFNPNHLLFVCTPDWKNYTFAHFDGEDPARAKLSTFSWDYQSSYIRTVCEFNLEALKMPETDVFGNYDPLHWLVEWKKAFDVERVTNKFFKDYQNVFELLHKLLCHQTRNKIWSHDYALQFLNRIMFLYFIQKRKWLGGNSSFMSYFWDNYKKTSLGENVFFENWLKVLFFEAFNNKFQNRDVYLKRFPKELIDIFASAPYLNGGLFTENHLDNVYDFNIPDTYFQILFDQFENSSPGFLEKYNFTITENTPFDTEVAVDPEMIGKVYESLVNLTFEGLTVEDMRGKSGIFYTPRVEIDLMCRLSLTDWLTNVVGDRYKDIIRRAVFAYTAEEKKQSDTEITNENLWKAFQEALQSISVIDPACGSGSFLIGMLMVIDSILERVNNVLGIQETHYDRRKKIIGQSLYGVDVIDWAVHIAELRLWLQLVIETGLEYWELKARPLLPNLSFKVRCGDSLVQEVGGVNFGLHTKHLDISNTLKGRLTKLKGEKIKYFRGELKNSEIQKKQIEQEEYIIFVEILKEKKLKLIQETAKLEGLINTSGSKQLTITGLEVNEPKQSIVQIEKWENEKNEKIAENVRIDDALRVIRDKKEIPFVWDIAFVEIFEGDKKGFDIVIGNPPYVRQEKISNPLLKPEDYGGAEDQRWKEQKRKYKEKLQLSIYEAYPKFFNFKHSFGKAGRKIDGKCDLYIFFYLHGLSLLNDKGSFCFITSNSWLDVGYGKDLQEFLLKNCLIKMIIDNQTKRSFEQADVNTVIVLFSGVLENTTKCNDNIARFIMLKTAFENVLNAEIFRVIENTNESKSAVLYRAVLRKQEDLIKEGLEIPDDEPVRTALSKTKYAGDKWGGKYLRAPDIFFTILEKGKDKLVRLGDIAEVRRGFTTGANEFFYLKPIDKTVEEVVEISKKNKYALIGVKSNSGWIGEIEAQYLKPVIKSPKELKRIRICIEELNLLAFMCSKNKNDLKNTYAIKYIEFGENKEYQDRPTLKSRNNWWDLGIIDYTIVYPSTHNPSWAVFLNDKFYLMDKVFYGISSDKFKEIWSFLNSTLALFQAEFYGYSLMGGGGSFITVEDLSNIKAMIIEELPNYCYKLSNRVYKPIFEELGFDKTKPIRLQEPNPQPDRKALDDIIFDALGLTEAERKEVYWSVAELVKNRLDKAKSV